MFKYTISQFKGFLERKKKTKTVTLCMCDIGVVATKPPLCETVFRTDGAASFPVSLSLHVCNFFLLWLKSEGPHCSHVANRRPGWDVPTSPAGHTAQR